MIATAIDRPAPLVRAGVAAFAAALGVIWAAAAIAGCQSVDAHSDPTETEAPPSCMDCHGHDYQGTAQGAGKDPAPLDHLKAGIGVGCADCHSQDAWRPAVAAAHSFPIQAGVHQAACVVCHNQPAAFSAFTCSTGFCHPKFKLTKQHGKVADFSSDSPACLHCHPEGK